jgi:hypothetical protein
MSIAKVVIFGILSKNRAVSPYFKQIMKRKLKKLAAVSLLIFFRRTS